MCFNTHMLVLLELFYYSLISIANKFILKQQILA